MKLLIMQFSLLVPNIHRSTVFLKTLSLLTGSSLWVRDQASYPYKIKETEVLEDH